MTNDGYPYSRGGVDTTMSTLELDQALTSLKIALNTKFAKHVQNDINLQGEIMRLRKQVAELEKKLDWLMKGNLTDDEVSRMMEETGNQK